MELWTFNFVTVTSASEISGCTALPQQTAVINLVMPDAKTYPFSLKADGTLINRTVPMLVGAVMTIQPDSSVKLHWKNETTWLFIPISQQVGSLLSSITYANGNTITLTRDPSNPIRVIRITHPVGRSLTLNYDSFNRSTSVVDPIGRTVQYSYNGQGTVAAVTDPAGGITKYDYDLQNRMIRITDPRGTVQMQNFLDANGRVIQQTRPDDGILTFTIFRLIPMRGWAWSCRQKSRITPIRSGISPASATTRMAISYRALTPMATISATDALSGVASFNVTGMSNEPMDPNDADILISGTGLGPRTVQLRADRLGAGRGRVYTVISTATDAAGNTVNAISTCTVPHDQAP